MIKTFTAMEGNPHTATEKATDEADKWLYNHNDNAGWQEYTPKHVSSTMTSVLDADGFMYFVFTLTVLYKGRVRR